MFAPAAARKSHRRLAVPRLLLSLLAWRHEARQKARLRLLDDRLLQDIGVTRAEAEAEADRPLWDSPAHWRG